MKIFVNILFFSQLFYPAIFGGGEYIFYQWAKELVKRGHKVFVVTQNIDGTLTYENFEGIEIFRVGASIKYKGNLPIGILQNFSYLLNSYFKGKKIIKKYKIDLIHSNTYIPVFSAQQCAKSTKIPHIATVHDVYYSSKKDFWKKWSNQLGTSKLIQLIGPLIEKKIASTNVTLFHTVSEESKKDLLLMGVKKQITVIPNGVELSKYYSQTSTKNQAIFVGRLVFYKNIEIILKAFQNVIKNFPDTKLVIIGEGPMKESLLNKTKNLGIEKNVDFVGQVSEEHKIKLISESTVLLNPSLIEGFGIVVLEGFACGKPVIVSDVKPLTDLIENSIDGYCLPSDNSNSWAEKISDLFSDKSKSSSMGQLGRNKVESSYSISTVTDKLLKMYESIL